MLKKKWAMGEQSSVPDAREQGCNHLLLIPGGEGRGVGTATFVQAQF